VVFAVVFRPTRCAGGKDKAKKAVGGNDVQMADAAGAAVMDHALTANRV